MSVATQNGEDVSSSLNSSPILLAFASRTQRDHHDRPPALEGVDLFHGSYRNYQLARHFHRVPAIGVVDRAPISSYLRKPNPILGTGTVLLLNPGEVHALASAGSGRTFRILCLRDKLFQLGSSTIPMQDLRFRQASVQDPELSTSLFRLQVELQQDGDKLRSESLLQAILTRLAERHAAILSHSIEPKAFKSRIDIARQYMEANYHRNLSLKELAGLSSLSASHFLRIFRDTVGLTPHAYLTQRRIEIATSLLRYGTPLVEVAHLVGFTDQSHFTKKFKRMLGITPGQYTLSSNSSRWRATLKSHRNRLLETDL